VLSIPAAFYFLKTAAANPRRRNFTGTQAGIFLSCFPVFIAYARLLACFFNMNSRLNSSGHVYELMCQVAITLYFTTEALMFIGKKVSVPVIAYGAIAVILISLSSFINLIFSAFWPQLSQFGEPVLYYAIDCALGIFILARIYSVVKAGKMCKEKL